MSDFHKRENFSSYSQQLLRKRINFGIIHLVRTQHFPKNQFFFPLIRTRVCVSSVRNTIFSENFT